MKNSVKLIIVAVLLVSLIGGASVLYNKFSGEYKNEAITTTNKGDSNSETSQNDFSAPDFTVLDYNGNEVKLSDYEGKPVVLNFWATWCYYCMEEMPDFNEASKKYPDVQFLMVNATDGYRETIDVAKKYIEEEKYEFDVFFDTKGEAVNAYYVNSFPSTFFIDEYGNLVTYANGMLDYDSLEKGINLLTQDK